MSALIKKGICWINVSEEIELSNIPRGNIMNRLPLRQRRSHDGDFCDRGYTWKQEIWSF